MIPALVEPMLAQHTLTLHSDALHDSYGCGILRATLCIDSVNTKFPESKLKQCTAGLGDIAIPLMSRVQDIADLGIRLFCEV